MIDARVLRVLRRLDEKKCPKLASELFSIHDAPQSVISAALRTGREHGLCICEKLDQGGKYWSLTEQGKAAIKQEN